MLEEGGQNKELSLRPSDPGFESPDPLGKRGVPTPAMEKRIPIGKKSAVALVVNLPSLNSLRAHYKIRSGTHQVFQPLSKWHFHPIDVTCCK